MLVPYSAFDPFAFNIFCEFIRPPQKPFGSGSAVQKQFHLTVTELSPARHVGVAKSGPSERIAASGQKSIDNTV
jgi:hypothetical protein